MNPQMLFDYLFYALVMTTCLFVVTFAVAYAVTLVQDASDNQKSS